MKNLILIWILVFLVSLNASATEQILEEIAIGNNSFGFYQTPLANLVSNEEFEKLFEAVTCSAAWRGYKGYWSISSGKLHLFKLERDPCGSKYDSRDWRNKSFDLRKIFPDFEISKISVVADWYSGEIVIPISESREAEGRKTATGHQVFEEQVIVYKIENGTVLDRKIEYRER